MFSNYSKDNNVSQFKITNIDLSIVNSIRRTILTNIKNVAFLFNVKEKNPETSGIHIVENDSPLHNEFLAHRLSMVPINLTSEQIANWNPEDYEFEIKVENNTKSFKDVTSKDIIVTYKGKEDSKLREQMFPSNKFTKEYIIITKLPPTTQTTKLYCKLKAFIGTAEDSACWATTSLCTFYNDIDEDTNKKNMAQFIEQNPKLNPKQAEVRYNTLDYQRAFHKNEYNEPDQFIFKIEPECILSTKEIFQQSLEYLIDKIDNLIDFKETKITVSNEKDFYKIILNDETHTIGNLLQSILYNIHVREKKSKQISFIGYFVPHPLEKRVFMKIVSSLEDVSFKQELIESFKNIKDILKNVLKEWLVFSKDFS